MDAVTYSTIKKFIGINNVDSRIRLEPVPADSTNKEFGFFLQQANNMEIDNTYALSSRGGFTSIGLTGTNIHSLWSDGDTAFYVDGNSLYQFNYPVTTGYLIRSGLTVNALMSYAVFNNRIYYSNGYQIGYIKNSVNYDIVNPVLTFKQPLPPGEFIEYFKGCLMVAKENVLYISDPMCDYYDIRNGYKQFSANINMVRSVDNGVYVSYGGVYFMKGLGNDEFALFDAYPFSAIPHTDVLLNGSFLGGDEKDGVAMWTGEDGICYGNNNGEVTNLTEARYTFTPYSKGAALVREKSNVRHYINSIF
jgi:hypothetical protein